MPRTTLKNSTRRRQQSRRFKLTVEGQPMLVDYTPNWMPGMGQFEFRSTHKPARRIPVSPTGYRGHFAPMDEIEAEDSPQDYARFVVMSFIRRALPGKIRVAEDVQPTFFGLLDRR